MRWFSRKAKACRETVVIHVTLQSRLAEGHGGGSAEMECHAFPATPLSVRECWIYFSPA